jgi:hypothetical protein
MYAYMRADTYLRDKLIEVCKVMHAHKHIVQVCMVPPEHRQDSITLGLSRVCFFINTVSDQADMEFKLHINQLT